MPADRNSADEYHAYSMECLCDGQVSHGAEILLFSVCMRLMEYSDSSSMK
jgi:hypothetical protein